MHGLDTSNVSSRVEPSGILAISRDLSCSSDFGNASAGSEGVVNSYAEVFNVCDRQ